MKKIYKYGTGMEVPEGAIYLCTKVEEGIQPRTNKKYRLVWHYFLVEVVTE